MQIASWQSTNIGFVILCIFVVSMEKNIIVISDREGVSTANFFLSFLIRSNVDIVALTASLRNCLYILRGLVCIKIYCRIGVNTSSLMNIWHYVVDGR